MSNIDTKNVSVIEHFARFSNFGLLYTYYIKKKKDSWTQKENNIYSFKF